MMVPGRIGSVRHMTTAHKSASRPQATATTSDEAAADQTEGVELTDEPVAAPDEGVGTVTADSNNPEVRRDGIQLARPANTHGTPNQSDTGPMDIMRLVQDGFIAEVEDPTNTKPGDQVISVTPRLIIADGASIQAYVDNVANKRVARTEDLASTKAKAAADDEKAAAKEKAATRDAAKADTKD